MAALQEMIHRNPVSHLFDRLYAGGAHWLCRVTHALRSPLSERGSCNSLPKVCADRSGTDCVLQIIRKSNTGIHPRILAQVTGYRKLELDKILHRLFTDGEIMVEPGGVYKSTQAFDAYRSVREFQI